MNVLKTVKNLESFFKKRGFSLFFVGGSVRDYLLYKEFFDIDLVTDATPKDMKEFLTDADFTFEKFGFVKLHFEGLSLDITTLRIEEEYVDSRHPKTIRFTNKLEEDVLRRDFTINGLYMDTDLHVFDYVNGVNDLNNKVIKMVGDPIKRLKEDPLRIIRAIRFSLTYNFDIDGDLKSAINESASLLENLNIEKIKQDIHKIRNVTKEEIFNKFKDYNIQKYYDVIK